MNHIDVICMLAQHEAKRAGGVLAESASFPQIQIRRDGNRYAVNGVNHAGHDNEDRMDVVCRYIRERVLPNVDSATNVSGTYKIELHDTMQPTDKNEGSLGSFCFSRSRHERGDYPLIPDEFQMRDYSGLLSDYSDPLSWDRKQPKALFCGTTTGDRNPAKNERLQACDWAARHGRGYSDFRITKVAQMRREDVVAAYPDTHDKFSAPHVPIEKHYEYRYLVNIAGNTCSWNRVPLIMNSRSLMLHTYHPDMTWYYLAMREGEHYVSTKVGEGLAGTMQFYESNPQEAQLITRNANRFVKQFMGAPSAILYMTMLLENVAWYHGR